MIFSGCSEAPNKGVSPGEPSSGSEEPAANIEEPPPSPDKAIATPPDEITDQPDVTAVDIVPLHPGHVVEKIPDSVIIKDAVNLMEGRISYRIPDTIKVDEAFYPTVMVSDTAFLEQKLREETARYSAVSGEKVELKEVKIAEIKIANVMRAKLSEPGNRGNFSIEPAEMIEQTLMKDNNFQILFQWTAIANKPGNFPLVLTLEAVFYKGEKEVIQKIPVFAEKVLVESIKDDSWKPYVFGGVFAAIFTTLIMWFRARSGNLITENVEAIIEKIGEGETAEAIKMLKAKELSNTNENLLVSHLAEFNDIRRQFNGGMIERAEMQMVVNRIHNSLLEICDEISRG